MPLGSSTWELERDKGTHFPHISSLLCPACPSAVPLPPLRAPPLPHPLLDLLPRNLAGKVEWLIERGLGEPEGAGTQALEQPPFQDWAGVSHFQCPLCSCTSGPDPAYKDPDLY